MRLSHFKGHVYADEVNAVYLNGLFIYLKNLLAISYPECAIKTDAPVSSTTKQPAARGCEI